MRKQVVNRAARAIGGSARSGDWRWASGALAALGVLCSGSAAEASTSFILFPSPFNDFSDSIYNYDVPTDGKTYLWQFSYTSADPNAVIASLTPPNIVDGETFIETPTGEQNVGFFTPTVEFTESSKPGLLSIIVEGQAVYDHCVAGVVTMTPCATQEQIGGDGVPFVGSADQPVDVTFTSTLLPEPADWMLMLTGVGLLGAALRRRRVVSALRTA